MKTGGASSKSSWPCWGWGRVSRSAVRRRAGLYESKNIKLTMTMFWPLGTDEQALKAASQKKGRSEEVIINAVCV